MNVHLYMIKLSILQMFLQVELTNVTITAVILLDLTGSLELFTRRSAENKQPLRSGVQLGAPP